MAYPRARSCCAELDAGMTDGMYKKVIMDRGGEVELLTPASRQQLEDVWHGIHEAPKMMLPDGRVCTDPYYVSMPGSQISV
jgi:hypothetical protein